LRCKKPFLEEQIRRLSKDILHYLLYSHRLFEALKTLADLVEAVIRAAYDDNKQSFDTTWETFKGVIEPFIFLETPGKHPTIKLHETSKNKGLKIEFEDFWDEGWTMKVFINY